MPRPPPVPLEQGGAGRLAAQLYEELKSQFTPIIDRLAADGVPPVITAQAMMSHAAHVIFTTAGEQELRQSLADTLDIVLPPRDARSDTLKGRSGSTRK